MRTASVLERLRTYGFVGRQPISLVNVLELDLPATPSELSFEGLRISVYFAIG